MPIYVFFVVVSFVLFARLNAISTYQVHLLRFSLVSRPAQFQVPVASYEPSSAPSPSIANPGPVGAPFSILSPRRRHRRHQRRPYIAFSPAPAAAPGCGQTCLDPLTSTPIGSPCGCVIPMKVKLLLNIAVYALFQEVNELEIDVAEGTYLKHSQVQIVGATADAQDQERTEVDINLVPLGNKFDNTTATLTSDRFWRKEVPLNKTLFGSYEVVSITYPGIPSPLPFVGSGPSESIGDGQFPITADVVNKSQGINTRTLIIIIFSAIVVCLACAVAVFIIIKCRKARKPSSAVGPAFTLSTNKKIGIGSTPSSSFASSTSMSPLTSMPACALSVKTFSLAELEKATEKFSSKRILGEGGFGRVYHGCLEDGTELAVKLLTRDKQSGDRDFIAEVEMLSRLHHRNLVKLIGICIQGHRRCLVYEVVHNGSVEYVAPEYAMTGHLLVKSDVYSYGVVLLELLSGRMPVDMSQPEGQENLVTWARPLLTSREGLEKLVDPSLAGIYNFEDMAKVASIASMCVHPEVSHRPFMGEVVQALKLIYNDLDDTCGDYASQRDSLTPDLDSKSDIGPSDSCWWNAGGISPSLTYGQASAFVTMDYSSGPLEDTGNRLFSASSLGGQRLALPIVHGNRSGPLRTIRSKPYFYRLKGSMSEHGGLLPKRSWNGGLPS
ncbi:hypothetical protein V2J09_003136 [Rumex salicifolius]